MSEIIEKPVGSFTKRCHRCQCLFRYTLADLFTSNVRGRDQVACPGCGEAHAHRDWRAAERGGR